MDLVRYGSTPSNSNLTVKQMETNRIRVRVHMLPTEDKSEISYGNSGQGKPIYHLSFRPVYNNRTYQHLHITTDEEIKEGDWYYNGMNKMVVKATNRYSEMKNPIPHRKIIASTDPKLEVQCGNNPNCKKQLPQPSQSFIKKYCELGGIDEVDVEYEIKHNCTVDGGANPCLTDMKLCEINGCETIYRLKVDSYNTITIHAIKDSWSRKEIEQVIHQAINDSICKNRIKANNSNQCADWTNNWIKENL